MERQQLFLVYIAKLFEGQWSKHIWNTHLQMASPLKNSH